MIDNEVLQELCEKVNLLDYAEKSMDFEQKGSDSWAAHCPRHVDKTPSLLITPSKNLFHCFSCNCGGNIINWLMTFEDMSFNDAVAKTVSLVGGDINSLKTCDAMAFYQEIKRATLDNNNNEIERTYLDIDKDYDQKYSNELPNEWLEEGITEQSLRKYDIRIDQNANRIVYPVLDDKYRLISVKGRTRYENYKTLKLPKYINYNKIGALDFFTGMKWAEDSIKQTRRVVILEGIKSVMKLDGWGIHNCVSAETSDITEQQLVILIKMGIKTAVIAFDEDVTLKKIYEITRPMKRYMNIEVVINKGQLLKEKMSPTDLGRNTWELLYKERKRL